MKTIYMKWALSAETQVGRILVSPLAWGWRARCKGQGIRLFQTRKNAREAQDDCRHRQTRIEKVRVIVETC